MVGLTRLLAPLSVLTLAGLVLLRNVVLESRPVIDPADIDHQEDDDSPRIEFDSTWTVDSRARHAMRSLMDWEKLVAETDMNDRAARVRLSSRAPAIRASTAVAGDRLFRRVEDGSWREYGTKEDLEQLVATGAPDSEWAMATYRSVSTQSGMAVLQIVVSRTDVHPRWRVVSGGADRFPSGSEVATALGSDEHSIRAGWSVIPKERWSPWAPVFEHHRTRPVDDGKTAYERAAAGGEHVGILRSYAGRTSAEIEKSIRGYEDQAAECIDKVASPENYAERWDVMGEVERVALMRVWILDARRNRTIADVLRGLLRSRR